MFYQPLTSCKIFLISNPTLSHPQLFLVTLLDVFFFLSHFLINKFYQLQGGFCLFLLSVHMPFAGESSAAEAPVTYGAQEKFLSPAPGKK